MNRPTLLLGALSALVLGAAPTSAQQLATGTWTGTMTPPGVEPVPVTYAVSSEGGVPSVIMRSVVVEGDIAFVDLEVQADRIAFWWDPGSGVRIDCVLTRGDDGAFEGPCRDGTPTGEGAIRMVPPDA